MKKVLLLMAVTFTACGKLPIPEPTADTLHYANGFEDASLSGLLQLTDDAAYNFVFDSTKHHNGNRCLKVRLRPQDFVDHGYRSELGIVHSAPDQSEMYYGFAIMIDSLYADTVFNVVAQWQDLPAFNEGESWSSYPRLHGSSPPVHFNFVNNVLELKINDNPHSDKETKVIASTAPLERGRWYAVVLHAFWSTTANGFLEAWVDGQHLTPYNGSDFKYYSRNLFTHEGNYMKFGQYRGQNRPAHENTIWFDDVHVGSSYEEVAP
jgi:hypothetical protein